MPRTKKESEPDNFIKCPNCGAKMPKFANYCGICRQPLSEWAKANDKNIDIVDEAIFLIIKEHVKKMDEDFRILKFLVEGREKPEFREKISEMISNIKTDSTSVDKAFKSS